MKQDVIAQKALRMYRRRYEGILKTLELTHPHGKTALEGQMLQLIEDLLTALDPTNDALPGIR